MLDELPYAVAAKISGNYKQAKSDLHWSLLPVSGYGSQLKTEFSWTNNN
jgi:hypothetical protein